MSQQITVAGVNSNSKEPGTPKESALKVARLYHHTTLDLKVIFSSRLPELEEKELFPTSFHCQEMWMEVRSLVQECNSVVFVFCSWGVGVGNIIDPKEHLLPKIYSGILYAHTCSSAGLSLWCIHTIWDDDRRQSNASKTVYFHHVYIDIAQLPYLISTLKSNRMHSTALSKNYIALCHEHSGVAIAQVFGSLQSSHFTTGLDQWETPQGFPIPTWHCYIIVIPFVNNCFLFYYSTAENYRLS